MSRRGNGRGVAALLDRARQQTGLEEFGADDFREGLNILLASLDEEARLNAQGRMAMDTQLVDLLANRLQVETGTACIRRLTIRRSWLR